MAGIIRGLVQENGSLPEPCKILESAFCLSSKQLSDYKRNLDKAAEDVSKVIVSYSYDGATSLSSNGDGTTMLCMGMLSSHGTQHLPFTQVLRLSDIKLSDENPTITLNEVVALGKQHLHKVKHKNFGEYDAFGVTLQEENVTPNNKTAKVLAVVKPISNNAFVQEG